MPIYLYSKKLDLYDGDDHVIVIHKLDAETRGLHIADTVAVYLCDKDEKQEFNMEVQLTDSLVMPGQAGIFADDWIEMNMSEGEIISISLQEPSNAINHIRAKIKGKKLSYEQMFSIVKDISNHRLDEVLVTYFLSAFYTRGFSQKEVYFLTKAMAETGELLKFPGKIVADKHSIGGVGGKGVTPIVASIAMAAGLLVPNTSTKAITTASATTDMLESIMPMSFDKEQLEGFAEKIGGFLVWGGGLELAPADDILIGVEKPIHLESYDKFTASIMAKKIAMGVTHLVIDLPKGPGTKVQLEKDVNLVKKKFMILGEEFDIKLDIYDRTVDGIDGNAVGPILEVREFLYVLERHQKKSNQLEDLSVELAGRLLELAKVTTKGNGKKKARHLLDNGKALEKFQSIVEIQGGDRGITADKIKVGKSSFDILSDFSGKISYQNNKEIFKVCRALGNPYAKKAGVYFCKRAGDTVKKGDKLATLYAESKDRLELGKSVWERVNVFGVK